MNHLNSHKPNPSADFRKILESLARSRSSIVSVFADFAKVSACALAAGSREEEYHSVIKSYSKAEAKNLSEAFTMLVCEMEQGEPCSDILGPYYTDIIGSAANRRGEYYTPPAVCEMLARISLDPEKIIGKGQPVTISDPACGSGGMILASGKIMGRHSSLLRCILTDVNPIAIDMAYINSTLFWIPATVICGNSLTMKFTAAYKNLPWIHVKEDQRQEDLKRLNTLRSLFEPAKEQASATGKSATIQGTFDFNF